MKTEQNIKTKIKENGETVEMDMNREDYKKYVKAHAKSSPILKNCLKAFLFGGSICAISQGLRQLYLTAFKLSVADASAMASVTLAAIAIVLTAAGVFDNIAKHAGAGTLVPITGFANAVSSPAIDSRAEGFVLGVGANMFKIAGPVIVYGTVTSVIYGIIYWIFK